MKNITINVAISYAMLLTSYLILGNQITDCRDQTNPTYSQFNTFCINKVCFPPILMTQHTVIRYQRLQIYHTIGRGEVERKVVSCINNMSFRPHSTNISMGNSSNMSQCSRLQEKLKKFWCRHTAPRHLTWNYPFYLQTLHVDCGFTKFCCVS
jgi:hypothetical protein